MLATYTITVDGLSKGNTITQPFSVEVTQMVYNNRLAIVSCCRNQADENCSNDAINDVLYFDLPAMSGSKNDDLTATFETTLTDVYGTNWSKV